MKRKLEQARSGLLLKNKFLDQKQEHLPISCSPRDLHFVAGDGGTFVHKKLAQLHVPLLDGFYQRPMFTINARSRSSEDSIPSCHEAGAHDPPLANLLRREQLIGSAVHARKP